MKIKRNSRVKHPVYGEGVVIGRNWIEISTTQDMDVEMRKNLVQVLEQEGTQPDSFTCKFGKLITSVPAEQLLVLM
jgi:hypothetical protein